MNVNINEQFQHIRDALISPGWVQGHPREVRDDILAALIRIEEAMDDKRQRIRQLKAALEFEQHDRGEFHKKMIELMDEYR